MLFLGYIEKNYGAVLKLFAEVMHTPLEKNGTLQLPEAYGQGYLSSVNLPNDLKALLFDLTIEKDVFLNREKSKKEFYTLIFDELHIFSNITFKVGKTLVAKDAHLRSTAVLTSSLVDFGYIISKGTKARGIHVMIPKEWVSRYLGIDACDKVLDKYIALKTASLNFEPLDARYRHMVNEALDKNKKAHPMNQLLVQNRIMMLIERFFTRLYKKMEQLPATTLVNDQELQQLMTIEYLLVNDFSKPPPTLPELAKMALMSPTKLKTLFKKVYDVNPFEYYQRSRMLKARFLLNSKKFSIKEVGFQLGFKNLSNFTIAYKKEFNMLPSDV